MSFITVSLESWNQWAKCNGCGFVHGKPTRVNNSLPPGWLWKGEKTYCPRCKLEFEKRFNSRQYQMRTNAVDDDTHFFDYQLLPACQYPVPSHGTPELETDCSAPAVARVWWQTDPKTTEPVDPMLVCHEHLQHILGCEKAQPDMSGRKRTGLPFAPIPKRRRNKVNNLEVTKVADGVYKFHPRNGGWGCRAFHVYPECPMSRPSGSNHVIYTLGLPSVVWWRGSEYGRDGYGLGIRLGHDWEAWYDGSSRSEALHIDIEKLMLAGIEGVFETIVGAEGLEITLLTRTVGEPQHLVVEEAHPLSDEERKAITRAQYQGGG